MKKIILPFLGLFIFSYTTVFAQQPDPVPYDLNNSVATPQGAGDPAESIDLSTGAIAPSIHLATLNSRDLSTSVRLVYTSGQGMRPNDIASWVGMGWNISAGGAIERTVKGLEDERSEFSATHGVFGWLYSNSSGLGSGQPNLIPSGTTINSMAEAAEFYHTTTPPSGIDEDDWMRYQIKYFQRISNTLNLAKSVSYANKEPEGWAFDNEPDVFNFHFEGYSGKFVFDKEGHPVLIPNQDIKIEPAIGPNASSYSGTNAWIFTTPDGTKYIFENTSDYIEKILPTASTGNTSANNNVTDRHNEYTSKWNLTRIISASGDEIEFHYDSETFNYDDPASKYYNNYSSMQCKLLFKLNGPVFGEFPDLQNTSTSIEYKNKKTIKEIIATNGNSKIEFQRSSEPRLDMPSSSSFYPLACIKLTNRNNIVEKKINFKTIDDPSYYDTLSSKTENFRYYQRRLKLAAIEIESLTDASIRNTYLFDYFPMEKLDVSTFNRVDNWGFKLNNGIPYYIKVNEDPQTAVIDSAYKSQPILNSTREGMLRSITFPGGVTEKFEYSLNDCIVEEHQYPWGGLRVKGISMREGNSQTERKFQVLYRKENGLSSGEVEARQINDTRRFFIKVSTNPYSSSVYNVLNSSSHRESASDFIRYSRVEVIEEGVGKTVHEFTGYESNPDLTFKKFHFPYTLPESGSAPVLDWSDAQYEYTSDQENDPGAPKIDKSFERGLPLKTTFYKENQTSGAVDTEYLMTKEIAYEYEFNPSGYTAQEVLAVKVNTYEQFLTWHNQHIYQPLHYFVEFYKHVSSWFNLKQKTTKIFELKDNEPNDNTNYLSETEIYNYSPSTLLMTSVISENSNGNGYLKVFRYPQDYEIPSSYSGADDMSNAIIKMAGERHIHNVPIESVTIFYPEELFVDGKVIAGDILTFKELSNDIIVPSSKYILKQQDIELSGFFVSFIDQAEPGSSCNFRMHNSYLVTEHYDRFDEFGRVIEMHPENGIPVSIQYDKTSGFASAKTVNAHRSYSETGDETSFLGFENAQASSGRFAENDFWNVDPGTLTNTDAHTGNVSQIVSPASSPDPAYSAARNFSPTNQSQKYKVSAWIKTQNGYGQVSGQKGELVIRITDDEDVALTPEEPGDYNAAEITDTRGQWKYFEAILDLGTQSALHSLDSAHFVAYACNYDQTYSFLIDDIRVQPLLSQMTTGTLDSVFNKISSTSDQNSRPVYYTYEGLGRPKLVLNQDRQILKEYDYKTMFYNYKIEKWITQPGVASLNDLKKQSLRQYKYEIAENAYSAENYADLIDKIKNDLKTKGFQQAQAYNASHGCPGPQASNKQWVQDNTPYGHCESYSSSDFVKLCCETDGTHNYYYGYYLFSDGTRSALGELVTNDNMGCPEVQGYSEINSNPSHNPGALTFPKCVQYIEKNKSLLPPLYIPYSPPVDFNFYTKSHIRVRVPTKPVYTSAEIDNLPQSDKSVVYQYYDCAGRPIQTVSQASSPAGKDVVGFSIFDEHGRSPKQYLPFADAASDGAFKTDLITKQSDFYTNAGNIEHTEDPWSEAVFENSPLGRVLESSAPGAAWKMGSGHTVKSQYLFNDENTVQLWALNYSSGVPAGAAASGTYSANLLYKTESVNENGQTTTAYTDKAGRLIAKRVPVYSLEVNDHSTTSDFTGGGDTPTGGSIADYYTYYVYDNFGRVVYEIPPAAYEEMTIANDYSFTESDAVFNDYITAYHYDERGRIRENKKPGQAAWNQTIYNTLNQVVLSQTPNQAANDQWAFAKYDAFGRNIITGIMSDDRSREDIETAVLINTTLWETRNNAGTMGYTNTAFPTENYDVSPFEIYKVNYYDDYDFDLQGHDYVQYSSNRKTEQVQAFATGTLVKLFDQASPANYLQTNYFYDKKGQLIQMHKQNHISGWDVTDNRYRFDGRINFSARLHFAHSAAAPLIIGNRFEYDHAGRLVNEFNRIGTSSSETKLCHYEYNELGQMIRKNLDKGTSPEYLQKVDYRYNIRGWLKSINDATLDNSDGDDIFGEQISYNDADDFDLDGTAGFSVLPQFNGSISAVRWKSRGSVYLDPSAKAEHIYAYRYDDLNRMTAAYYGNNGTLFVDNYFDKDFNMFDEKVMYDIKGNILNLQRSGQPGVVDILEYSYNGNQLMSIADAGGFSINNDFKDGSNITDDYAYDANGNLTLDENKGITGIAYNYFNLPEEVTDGSNTVSYLYDANGSKLRKTESGSSNTHDYVDGIEYINNDLQFITTSQGRARPNGVQTACSNPYLYDYFLKDHLGNVRAIVTRESNITPLVYLATMETDSSTAEGQYFENLDASRDAAPAALQSETDVTNPNNDAAKLNQDEHPVGPALWLQVRQGDKIGGGAKYYYSLTGAGDTPDITTILANLGNIFFNPLSGHTPPGLDGTLAYQADQTFNANNAVIEFIGDIFDNADDAKPLAFLTYLTFDRQFNFIESASGVVQISNNGNAVGNITLPTTVIPVDGYTYIYLSNESAGDVYFDDFMVSHSASNVLELTDYYPYGLINEPLSTSNTFIAKNNYKYQDNELNTMLSYNVEEFAVRHYDPAIGRWNMQDPAGQYHNPYLAMGNNPVSGIDPDGAWDSYIQTDWSKYQKMAMDQIEKFLYRQIGLSVDGMGSGPAMMDHWAEINSKFEFRMAQANYWSQRNRYNERIQQMRAMAITPEAMRELANLVFNVTSHDHTPAPGWYHPDDWKTDEEKSAAFEAQLGKAAGPPTACNGCKVSNGGQAGQILAGTLMLGAATSEVPPAAAAIIAGGAIAAAAVYAYEKIGGKDGFHTTYEPVSQNPIHNPPNGFDPENPPPGWGGAVNWMIRVGFGYKIYDEYQQQMNTQPPYAAPRDNKNIIQSPYRPR